MSFTIPEMEATANKVLNCPTLWTSSYHLPNLHPKETQLSVNSSRVQESTKNNPSSEKLSQNSKLSSNIYTSLSNSLTQVPFHVCVPSTSSSVSAGSTLIELHDRKPAISCDKKLRRMISNRESAKRSRIRRKKQIEELQSQINQLQNKNNLLAEKVISLLESNQHILQQNSQLHDTISSLEMALVEQLATLSNVAESTCNTNPIRGETSN